MIISRTPVRISFFGGGTDYPTWFKEHGGKVLATAINKYTYISCRYLPPFFEHKYRIVYSKIENVSTIDQIVHPAVRAVLDYMKCSRGVEIHHDGDLPARSGLGSSSSFTVGLLNALYAMRGQYRSSHQLAEEAIHVEQNIIAEHVGSQDQITTAFGGFNRVEFFQDGSFDVSPVIISNERFIELQSHFVLLFTGISRFASEVAKSKIENFEQRRTELYALGAMVDEAISILNNHNVPITEFGKLLHQAWELKRRLSDKVSNDLIDDMYQRALDNGAVGGKVLGAGGGGFILFMVPPERQATFLEHFTDLVHVPFQFEPSGTRIVVYQPDGFH